MHGLHSNGFDNPAIAVRPALRSGATALRYGYPSSRLTAAQAWSMACRPPGGTLPPIYVSARDHARLTELVRACLPEDSALAPSLAAELKRAIVLPSEEMPEDVVTMDARVVYRVGPEHRLRFGRLVYPERRGGMIGDVPIISPEGVALLGLAENSPMPFVGGDGAARWLSVERVVR